MAIPLLHARGRAGIEEARRWAARLAEALGVEVAPRAVDPAARGESTEPGAWRLLAGAEAVAAASAHRARVVVLPRRDPRWSLEDLVKRPIDRLPPGCRVVTPPGLGEALLQRERPDLVPVRAGGFPTPEETPVLAEGPYDGRPAGDPLEPSRFVPAVGTGHAVLVPPGEEAPPEGVRSLEDRVSRHALEIEAAFCAGVGELPAGASLGVLARRKLEGLYSLRYVRFAPGGAPLEATFEVPQADRVQFARAFGRHLRGGA
jgi:hypothetical protein